MGQGQKREDRPPSEDLHGCCRLPAELPTCPGPHPTHTEERTQTDGPATGPHREGHSRLRSNRKRWQPRGEQPMFLD